MYHAKYSPSKLSRIIACPGSVGLSEHLPPSPSSPYAEEGTLLHAIATECLERRPDYAFESIEWETPEHKYLVKQCIEKLDELLSTMDSFQLYLDTRVFMQDIDCNGTLDIGVAEYRKGILESIHVIDLKFGGGVEVSPIDNAQGQAYLDGFCNLIGHNYNQHKDVPMFFWIYQPRLYAFDGERYFPDDLQYFRNRLEKAIRLAEGHNAPYHPGAAQCRWCPAGGVCKARMADVKKNVVDTLSAYADRASWDDSMESIESLSKLLQTKTQIANAMEAIEAHLFTQLSRGQKVPGYKLVAGRASRQWASHVDAFTLNELFPKLDTTDLIEAKLLSPAKVEKLLTKEEREALAELVIRIEGAPTMASEKSAKVELGNNIDKAKSAFSGVTGD